MQGAHLDLDAALTFLVHRWHADERPATGPGPGPEGGPASSNHLPVPRHRIGPVVQAMLLAGRRHGDAALAHRMADLIEALDRLGARARDVRPSRPGHEDAAWWAARLLRETLLKVADARPYAGVLRVLAGRITRAAGPDGVVPGGAYTAFDPWFWRRLRLPMEDRVDLLRLLMPADGGRDATARSASSTRWTTC